MSQVPRGPQAHVQAPGCRPCLLIKLECLHQRWLKVQLEVDTRDADIRENVTGNVSRAMNTHREDVLSVERQVQRDVVGNGSVLPRLTVPASRLILLRIPGRTRRQQDFLLLRLFIAANEQPARFGVPRLAQEREDVASLSARILGRRQRLIDRSPIAGGQKTNVLALLFIPIARSPQVTRSRFLYPVIDPLFEVAIEHQIFIGQDNRFIHGDLLLRRLRRGTVCFRSW